MACDGTGAFSNQDWQHDRLCKKEQRKTNCAAACRMVEARHLRLIGGLQTSFDQYIVIRDNRILVCWCKLVLLVGIDAHQLASSDDSNVTCKQTTKPKISASAQACTLESTA